MANRPKIGKDFPIDDVAILTAKRSVIAEITRSTIAIATIAVVLVLIVSSFVIGLWSGSFDLLQMVWSFTAVPLGSVFGYYLSIKTE